MYKNFILVIILSIPFVANAQRGERRLLDDLIKDISTAKNLYVEYQVNTVRGKFSIGEEAVYLSQDDKIEIFEFNGSRYIYNPKRNRVDIETIKPIDDNIKHFLNWTNNADKYTVTIKERGGDRKSSYTLTKDKEVVEVDLSSNGELLKFTYESSEIKKVSFNIKKMTINEKSTLDFFTFNPKGREDLIVTDYR